jgi:hypothetical protein
MTDILDDSYESDLTEEESEQLLMLCGHAIGPSLSPAARAVLDTMHRSYDHEPTRRALAAGVLRAAVDQVEELYCQSDLDNSDGVVFALRQFMLIAAELEAQQ